MDKFKVTIFIETSFHGPAIRQAAGAWLIEYIKTNGEPETRQGIISKDKTTENALALELLKVALGKLTKPCSIRVNTECDHILNVMRNYWLPQWEKNDWRNSKNKLVKNAELWQQCQELMMAHSVTFDSGEHSYRKVMQADIKKELEG